MITQKGIVEFIGELQQKGFKISALDLKSKGQEATITLRLHVELSFKEENKEHEERIWNILGLHNADIALPICTIVKTFAWSENLAQAKDGLEKQISHFLGGMKIIHDAIINNRFSEDEKLVNKNFYEFKNSLKNLLMKKSDEYSESARQFLGIAGDMHVCVEIEGWTDLIYA